ncbi:MAG: ATP-dependent protease [Alphaproteobacteria bacterium]|nr:ATP-dependent protease [Alphaproteobacteria bacterium]
MVRLKQIIFCSLPIRVELKALSKDDFVRILTEPEANLIRQAKAMLETESVTLAFTDDAIQEIATLAAEVNRSVENIGARRLHTILEKLMEDISFKAPEIAGETITITHTEVREKVSDLAYNTDLSKFIL